MDISFNIWLRTQAGYLLILLAIAIGYIIIEPSTIHDAEALTIALIVLPVCVLFVEALFSLPAILLIALGISIIKRPNIVVREKLIITAIIAALSFYACALFMGTIVMQDKFTYIVMELIFNLLTLGVILSSSISIYLTRNKIKAYLNNKYTNHE